jgi:ubiquinone/menaquinone biosynthesis C-methylase UbiE
MLPRILEPEVMDTPEEARDYDAMDHAAVNDRFADDLLASRAPRRGGLLLDVGTGTARIPIAIARRDPDVRIVAIDLADHMLALGRRNVEAAGLAHRITLRRADAKATADADARFDTVASNSIVHHIPEPSAVLTEMVRLVAPGGTLFVRDLARPPDLATLDSLVAQHAGHEPEPARALFAASLHAALTIAEVQALVAPLGIPPEAVAPTSDRHWTLAWKRPAP